MRPKKIRESGKKKTENRPKKYQRISAKKMRENQIFFPQKPLQWFSKFWFWGRVPAGRNSRRMYCRRRLPELIGTQKFEAKKIKN